MTTGSRSTAARTFGDVPATTVGADHSALLRWAAERLGTDRLTTVPGATRERHWSFVTAADTASGRVWIKANARGFAHEAAIVDLVTAAGLDVAVPALAVDVERPDGS
ncbi:hypothetical protein [Cellulomonas sp. URHB0016]